LTIKRLILVTAKHHPSDKFFKEVLEEVSIKLGVQKEIKEEDYIFANTYGEKDEFGFAWLPQLFAEYEDGTIKPLITQIPLDKNLSPDKEAAIREVLSKV
jgi:hypothetical protein